MCRLFVYYMRVQNSQTHQFEKSREGFGCRCAPSDRVNSMAPMLLRPSGVFHGRLRPIIHHQHV